MFSDSHCHLYMSKNIDQVIKEGIDCGVGLFLNTAVDYESSIMIVNSKMNKNVKNIIGISPEFAEKDINKIEDLCKYFKYNVVGIGEIGLDIKILDAVSMEKQLICFEKQLEIAKKYNLPVVIHSRGALETVEKLLYEKDIDKAVFHFF